MIFRTICWQQYLDKLVYPDISSTVLTVAAITIYPLNLVSYVGKSGSIDRDNGIVTHAVAAKPINHHPRARGPSFGDLPESGHK